MNRTRVVCVVLAAVSTMAIARPVLAADTKPDPAWLERAAQMYDQADELFVKGKYDEARALLEGTWTMFKHWQTASALGAAELKTGRYRQAAEHFAFALRKVPKDAKPEDVTSLRQWNVDVLTKVATVRPRGLRPGWRVLVNDRLVGESPLEDPIFLDPGTHTLLVRKDNEPSVERRLVARAGTSMDVDFSVPEPARTTPSPSGDERSRGWDTRTWIGLGGGVLSLAALGIGIGASVRASSLQNDANSLRASLQNQVGSEGCLPAVGQCGELARTYSDRDSAATLANVGYVGFGVLAAATVVTVLVLPKAKPSSRADRNIWLLPQAGTTNGIVAGATF